MQIKSKSIQYSLVCYSGIRSYFAFASLLLKHERRVAHKKTKSAFAECFNEALILPAESQRPSVGRLFEMMQLFSIKGAFELINSCINMWSKTLYFPCRGMIHNYTYHETALSLAPVQVCVTWVSPYLSRLNVLFPVIKHCFLKHKRECVFQNQQ